MATVPQATPNERLAPPRFEVGAIGWVRQNLFNSWYNSALTVISAAIIVLALVYGLRWVITVADWSVIGVLGGRMVIGQYNTEGACPGQNCFWRPQVSLLLVSALFGMGWALAGGGVAKRLAIGVVVILALFALLPYSFERMGMDVRAAAGGQRTGDAGRMGSCPLHEYDGTGHRDLRGILLCGHLDPSPRDPWSAGTAVRACDPLGRHHAEPPPGGGWHRAELAHRDRPGPGKTQQPAGGQAAVVWCSSRCFAACH